ncbi:MAG: phosphoenolpyruvate carboxylase [Pirellulaceae bacterium]|nr:phosphoenolpyruvate carboxylase [Pirellulaceae bacterium]
MNGITTSCGGLLATECEWFTTKTMIDEQLKNEVRWLGEMLGATVDALALPGGLQRIEKVRELAKRRRAAEVDAERNLIDALEALSEPEAEDLIRAFSLFFDLVNLAEDRQRARVLRDRDIAAAGAARSESIGEAIAKVQGLGISPDDLQNFLNRLAIEPVFTAHPTEAKRRSLREKIRDLREHLRELDNPQLTPREKRRIAAELRADLTLLWQTDFLRERRPTVLEELARSLFFFETLWQVIPNLYEELETALQQHFPDQSFVVPEFLRFGTWIGGDRDGNPFVTWQITADAMQRLREVVLQRHYLECRALRRALSVSRERVPVATELTSYLEWSCGEWPELVRLIEPIAPAETYRRYLRMVQWRIEQTQASGSGEESQQGAYRQVREFMDDLERMERSLLQGPGGAALATRLARWIRRARVFGFHAMRMDIRQESGWYADVMDEVFRVLGVTDSYLALSEVERQRLLSEPLENTDNLDPEKLSENGAETLRLFRLLAETVQTGGVNALGCQVISMTRVPSDVLTVLWLGRWGAQVSGIAAGRLPLPIVPLFETIGDLRDSAQTLRAILSHPAYAEHLRETGGEQTVMIGYSDSTKDGGFLAAAWAQYQAQVAMSQVGRELGVRIKFFHGRGGSLGRGGGPAARSILSSPRTIIDGAMRVTEQGEVLSARYDDPQIALRHLEQVISATILVSLRPDQPPHPEWLRWMEELADRAYRSYRGLVEMPGFIEYFDRATPIGEIERLPIGSRPPRRGGVRSLDKLRAIPWVFSWTQNRHFLPAWFGVGAALDGFAADHPDGLERLRAMYDEWPFFHGMIENAALALAKSDLGIARCYAGLMPEGAEESDVWQVIEEDHRRSTSAILQITRRQGLLDEVPWLQESIEVRNPYVDPLNFLQIVLLKRQREREENADLASNSGDRDELGELLRLTIQGVAAGLRATG